jgi:hypothetical protein
MHVSDVMSEVLPGDDMPMDGDVVQAAVHDADEADDQLAMFGVVRPTDPEPVKARRSVARRPRKGGEAETAGRPRRGRKSPANPRSGSRRSRS